MFGGAECAVGLRLLAGVIEKMLPRLIGKARGVFVGHPKPRSFGLAALPLSRLLTNLLYGISSSDPLTYFSAGGLLLVIGAAASALPGLACGDTGPAADAASRIAGILGLASFNLATERSTSCAMD